LVFDAGQSIAFLLACQKQGQAKAGENLTGGLQCRVATNCFSLIVAYELTSGGKSFVDLVIGERLHWPRNSAECPQ
jgi:hypothetical protein